MIKGIINKSYKGNRHEDDLNQPLSVQPWGSDSDKRRYYLIEGLDDTHFRVYRESNPQGFNRTWWSVAGSIEELKALADKLHNADGGPKAKKLAQKMYSAVPRFEATDEKRKRREYRLLRKEQFKRPEPGFSMYEGRTRGKRMKYTYSDDEDFLSDSTSVRRSSRNTRQPTPVEPAGPVTTASGRQIKAPSRMTVDASNNIVTTSPTASHGHNEGIASKESSAGPTGRPRRSAAVNHGTNGWASSSKNNKNDNSADEDMEDYDEDDDDSEPELGDDEEDHVPDDSDEEEDEFDEDEEMVDDDLDNAKDSMMVKLKLPSKGAAPKTNGSALNLDGYRYNGKKNGSSKSQSPSAGDSGISEKDDFPEEVISVATTRKHATPEKSPAISTDQQPQRPPSTPALNSLQSTSLAFRESPDKVQALPKPVDVGAGD